MTSRLRGTALALTTLLLAVPLGAPARAAAPAPVCRAHTIGDVADWNGDGHQDIIARQNSTGDLLMYPGQGGISQPGTPVKIGNGWSQLTIGGVTDWNGDGHQDVIARYNGDLLMYPGDGTGGYPGDKVRIGNGWDGYDIGGLADWDHDGHQDIIAVQETTGELLMYPGDGGRGPIGTPVKIGDGWDKWRIADVADWSRDGHQDVIAYNPQTDEMWLHPGESKRGISSIPPLKIGDPNYGHWGRMTFVGIADWDGGGHQDLITIYTPSGDLWMRFGKEGTLLLGFGAWRVSGGWC